MAPRVCGLCALGSYGPALAQNKKAPAKPSALDQYVEQALRGTKVVDESSPGSLFTNAGDSRTGFATCEPPEFTTSSP